MSDEHGHELPDLPAPGDLTAGVFLATADGLVQVHAYLGGGGDYGLDDVSELLGLGAVDRDGDWLRLRLTRSELRELKATADAFSFDYPAELIEMCMDMVRGAGTVPGEPVVFLSNF